MKTYRCDHTVNNVFSGKPIFKEGHFYVATYNAAVNQYTFLTYEDSELYPDIKFIVVSKIKFKKHFRIEPKTFSMKLHNALK